MNKLITLTAALLFLLFLLAGCGETQVQELAEAPQEWGGFGADPNQAVTAQTDPDAASEEAEEAEAETPAPEQEPSLPEASLPDQDDSLDSGGEPNDEESYYDFWFDPEERESGRTPWYDQEPSPFGLPDPWSGAKPAYPNATAPWDAWNDWSTRGEWESIDASEVTYLVNTGSGRFHKLTCPGVADILDRNKLPWTGTREELLAEGYLPCGLCRP